MIDIKTAPQKKRNPLCYVNSKDGTEMVLVPGSWFLMGSVEEDPKVGDDEKPRHLHFVDSFYIGLACITVAQFRRFVNESRYIGGDYTGTGNSSSEKWNYWKKDPPDYPVRYINWYDCRVYCEWAGLRLPGEAEWELCARGYGNLKYPWGNDWEEGRRICWDKQKGPKGETSSSFGHPEGVSRFGTYQQSGNLWEWCEDVYCKDAYKRYAKDDLKRSSEEVWRVMRGGSWYGAAARAFRGAYRSYRISSLEDRRRYSGLRVARTVTV